MRALRVTLLSMILVAPAILVMPGANASVSTTPIEQDIWNQISAPLTGTNSGFQASDGLTLTAGQTYYLYIGTNAVFGSVVSVGSGSAGSADLVSINMSGAIIPGTKGADAALVSMANTSQTYNPYYAILRVTPTTSANYYLGTNSGGFGSPGSLSMGWLLPPGDTPTHSAVLGFAGAWHGASSSTELAFAIKSGIQQVSEGGALSEISKTIAGTWDDTKATWMRANPAKNQYDTSLTYTASDAGTSGAATRESYQSFTPDLTLGSYLERFSFYFATARLGGSGNMKIAVFTGSSPPAPPVDLTQARAEVDFTYSQIVGCGCAASARYVVNWTNATVTARDVSGSTASTSGVTWKEFGSSVTTPRAPSIVPANPATDKVYVYIYYTLASDGTFQSTGLTQLTNNAVPNGEYAQLTGGNWIGTTNYDLAGLQIGLYGGASVTAYTLGANAQTHGGAFWAYVRERVLAANPQQYTLSSNFGGSAKAGGFQFANATYVIQEWRLGYATLPWTTTSTLEIDVNTTGSLSNVVEIATFTGQATTTHWHPTSFSGGMFGFSAIELFTTDDYFTQISFSVKECLDAACATLGNPVNATAYVATICTGAFQRTLSGNVDANASFNITGQDIPNCAIAITLTASGYSATPWSVTVQSAGNYAYTLGILKSSTVAPKPILGSVQITWSGNTTRTIPDRIWVNITRGRAAPLFVGADHLDPASGAWQHNVIAAIPWAGSDANTFQLLYPNRAKTSIADSGLYLLWVMNDTGVMLSTQKAFIEPAGTNWTQDDATITPDVTQQIAKAGYLSAQQSIQEQQQASLLAQRLTTRDLIYADFQNINTYGWWFVGLLFVLAAVRAFRR